MSLTSGQAERLGVEAHRQLSPGLEVCCLRASANVSYQHAAEDVEMVTGLRIAAATQQRLVHRHTFAPPQLEQPVQELSVEGGQDPPANTAGPALRWAGL